MMALERIEEPRVEPVLLDEVKKNSEISALDDDTFIRNLVIPAVRSAVEAKIHRALVVQRWRYTMDAFPPDNGAIALLVPPLICVEPVAYIDEEGVEQTLAEGADVITDGRSEPARIVPAYGKTWPRTRRQVNAVSVVFKAGYLVPCTADVDADAITPDGHIYGDGDLVSFSAIGIDAAVPGGLTAKKPYYTVNADGASFQVSETPGGAPISLSDEGSGQLFTGVMPESIRQAMILLAAHFNEFREPVISGSIATQVPFSFEALLAAERFDWS